MILRRLDIKSVLLAVLFFFLPCALSYPGRAYYWLVKLNDNDNVASFLHTLLIPSILWALAFLCIRMMENNRSLLEGLHKDWMTVVVLLSWFLAATLSYEVNDATGITMITYSACYLSCVLIYLALRDIRISREDIRLIFLAMSIGSLFPLLLGLRAYYNEWGIPSPTVLLYSRYETLRMAGYMEATFGNTSNTAPFLLLTGLPLFTMVMDRECGKALRLWFLFVLILTVLHMLIIQSRASIITFAASMALILLHRRVRLQGLLLVAVVMTIFLLPMLGSLDQFINNLTAALFVDTHDNSVFERATAMQEAWTTFSQNWQFGIGPGGTLSRLSFTSAHQFFLQQAAELGIVGLFSSLFLAMIVFYRAVKAAFRDYRKGFSKESFTFLIGPFAFIFYATIGNAPLNIGVVNTFIGLFTAYLALSQANWTTLMPQPDSDRTSLQNT